MGDGYLAIKLPGWFKVEVGGLCPLRRLGPQQGDNHPSWKLSRIGCRIAWRRLDHPSRVVVVSWAEIVRPRLPVCTSSHPRMFACTVSPVVLFRHSPFMRSHENG